MTIGERIRETRKQSGMTQSQLAAKSGVAAISIHQYESGKREPRIEQLQRIADALGVGTSYLLGGGDTVSETHLANGVHIYKNTFPFKVIEPFLADPLSNSRNIAYQDEYLLISVDKDAAVTPDELEKIIDAYTPFREKMADERAAEIRDYYINLRRPPMERIEDAFEYLTPKGQEVAADFVEIVAGNPFYCKQTTTPAPQPPAAPEEGTDTTPLTEGSEGPQEGGEGE